VYAPAISPEMHLDEPMPLPPPVSEKTAIIKYSGNKISENSHFSVTPFSCFLTQRTPEKGRDM
jgi:hypothetical protein